MPQTPAAPVHSAAFRARRLANWLPLGLTYMFLYMGRYNLTVAKTALGDLMTKEQFGGIFGVGALVYGVSFLLNGPLTDRLGGRFAILMASAGAALMNFFLGLATMHLLQAPPGQYPVLLIFTILYAGNMYFQSFGAVAIVKVNSNWFHVRERGTFGGIFGVLISAGIYMAFDIGGVIVAAASASPGPEARGWLGTFLRRLIGPGPGQGDRTWWIFFIPAILLFLFFLIDLVIVRNKPSGAGFEDFHLGDATADQKEESLPLKVVLKKMLTNPVILTIAGIEFCSGILRNGIMHWFLIYAKETTPQGVTIFVQEHWGLVLLVAGVLGGIFAGFVSDLVFGSRRGPVASILYAGMIGVALGSWAFLSNHNALGWTMAAGSLFIIGVHGMLSGTASADFGGSKNAGTAVGLIDGCVYLGTGFQSVALGYLTTKSWSLWPPFLLLFAVLGFLLTLRILKAYPESGKES